MAGPWEKYAQPQPPAIGGRPVYQQQPDPYKERDQQLQEEEAARQREEARRKELEWNATHNPDGTEKAKPGQDDSLKAALRDLGIDELLTGVRRAREQVKTGWATGTWGAVAELKPGGGTPRDDLKAILGQIQGGIILEKLQSLKEASKTGASGMGALSEKEGERLASAVAALNDQMSAEEMQRSFDEIERHASVLRAIAEGKDPRALMGDSGSSRQEMAAASNGYNETPDTQSSAFWERAARAGVPYEVALKDWQKAVGERGLQGVTPPPPGAYRGVVDYIASHPDTEYHPFSSITRTPISEADQTMSQAAMSAPGSFIVNAGNGLTAGLPLALAGDQGDYFKAASNAEHPVASTLGDIAGSTAGMLLGEGALGRAGMNAGLKRELTSNMIYGGVRGGAEDGWQGALEGAGAGAAGTVAGNMIFRGAGAALRGVQNADVNALSGAGVRSMTMGQIAGGKLKSLEDKATSIPGVGGMINSRRTEGLREFNSAAFDHALKPIGAKVGNLTGEEAVAKSHEFVGQAFSTALKGKAASPDQEFIKQARGPLTRLAANKRIGEEIVGEIEAATQGLFDEATGTLSGENMQAFLQALRQIKDGYRNDPLFHTTIKPSIQGIENAVEGMFQRQVPDVMPQYRAAKAASRRLSILSDAVNRGKNTEGVFTPGQLGMADRGNSKKFDGAIASASGKSQFFDLQRAGQNVLPNKVPDSGTAGRAALMLAPGAVAASGAGVGYAAGDAQTGSGVGLGLVGMLAALYTKTGQKAVADILLKRLAASQAAGTALQKAAPVGGAVGAAAAQTNPGQ